MGWFFGFKLHLVFNTCHEIVALTRQRSKTDPWQWHQAGPGADLTGKLFGDKGYIGRKLAEDLLRRGLTLFTRSRRNMKALPISLKDKALLRRIKPCSMRATWPTSAVPVHLPQNPHYCIEIACFFGF
jgi:hypothetical protein